MSPRMHPLDQQLQANIQGDFETGWRLSEMMWKTDSQDDRVAFNRGWHVLGHGDLQGGMELIDRGRNISVFGSKDLGSSQPKLDGKRHDIAGKTVLMRGEGGLGDEIINVRFANDFAERGAKVVVSASAQLAPLFARMPGVSGVVQHGVELGVFHDYWVPGMSAVRETGHTYQTLPGKPYLGPTKEHSTLWRSIMKTPSGDLKVGIRWSGNPQFEHQQHRRFSPDDLIGLRTIPGVKVFSFQRDTDLRPLPREVVDLQLFLGTWEDTAAALNECDLVITSCTSVAHLAAALGKETWIILPILPYYTWAVPGERSPWYESVRLFRQTTYGDWSEPLRRVREALLHRVSEVEQRRYVYPSA